MNQLQLDNLHEIEALNQRGGRMLSFVDLIRAGTMSPEMVAHCWTAIAHGASFLTAARPGGAGKSTVLANLLALLPPDEQIITWRPDLPAPPAGPACYLAHEIGSGPWFGYIWGADVGSFLSLREGGHRVASCLHADSLGELRDILCHPPLAVSEACLHGLGMVLFIHLASGNRRRVAALHEATGSGHRLAFVLDDHDCLVRQGPSELFPRVGADEAEYECLLQAVWRIVGMGESDLETVREHVLAAYASR